MSISSNWRETSFRSALRPSRIELAGRTRFRGPLNFEAYLLNSEEFLPKSPELTRNNAQTTEILFGVALLQTLASD